MKATMSFLFAGLVISGLVYAGTDARHEIRIEIDDDSGQAPLRVDLDSQEMGFTMDELEDGESRSFVDADGRNILLSRQGGKLVINVDGREIDLPGVPDAPLPPEFEHNMAASESMHHAFVIASEIAGGGDLMDVPDMGLTVIAGRELDDATQQSIRDALKNAGVTDDVRFIQPRKGHQQIVIRKHIEKVVPEKDPTQL